MSGTDKFKFWIAGLLVIVAIYVAGYAEVTTGLRFASTAVALAAAAVLVIFSQSGKDFSRFVREAGVELRKVVWPNKQEVMQMTGMVLLFLALVTVFLWFIDLVIGFLIDELVR